MKALPFADITWREPDGDLRAWVLALPGCHTQADTLDELRVNLREAIEALELVGSVQIVV